MHLVIDSDSEMERVTVRGLGLMMERVKERTKQTVTGSG